jgi:cyclopropane fatty-acyl-phospholipid synthase-like methyltransferase
VKNKKSTIEYYNNNAFFLAKRYESAAVDVVQELILNTFHHKAKLLELGCGVGREISFLLKKDYDVLGTDASESMLAQAVLYHPELQGRLIHLTMPSAIQITQAYFDGAYSIAMLMHLQKDDIFASLTEIYKIL